MTLSAFAQIPTELEEIQFSGDIDHRLPTIGGNTVGNDETISIFTLSDGTALGFSNLGQLNGADVDAYHVSDSCGAALYSLDSTAEVSGTVMRPADIFASFGSKILDAQAEGISDGVNIDATSRDPDTCDVVFSVDIFTELDGTTYEPNDLIAWNDTDGFSLFRESNFTGDIDAVHILEAGRLLFSVASDTDLFDLVAQDEDVIEQIPSGPGSFFVLAFSPSAFDNSWQVTDLDAVWAQRAPLAGVFQWETPDVEVFENAGSVSVSVERINGSEGSIDINWTTLADTATDGADYTGASGVLTFADGATSGPVTITLLNDALVEGTEEFIIRINTVSGTGIIGDPRDVRVIIRDDEDFIFADSFEN